MTSTHFRTAPLAAALAFAIVAMPAVLQPAAAQTATPPRPAATTPAKPPAAATPSPGRTPAPGAPPARGAAPAPAAEPSTLPLSTFRLSANPSAASVVPPTITLDGLIELAKRNNPGLAATRARIDVARGGLITARAIPNPEIEVQGGRQDSRADGTPSGASGQIGVLQPIERPGLRAARREVAVTGIDAASAEANVAERDLLAELKLRYFDILRLQAAARLAEEDLSIAEQIRTRVQVRVGTGEAPRFELIRADTERLNAQRAVQAAAARIDLARADLRRLVGPQLPPDFTVDGNIADAPVTPLSLEAIRTAMLERHPEIVAARAAVRTAESRIALEQERRKPSFGVRATMERLPEANDARLGLVMQIPVFDRREGPIAEATAEAERARLLLADRELRLNQSLESAWQRYRIALGQVAAYESGLLREAEAALRVAEAAYRFGERGILDFLDAQRTFRTLRSELNTTRYDLRAALVELERLRAESE
jgi:cobalt-zinc-cadmium efflux system outer membrane protein